MCESSRHEVLTTDDSSGNKDAVVGLNPAALRDREAPGAQSTDDAIQIRYSVGLALCDYLRMSVSGAGSRRFPMATELLEAVLRLQPHAGRDPGSLPQ